MTLLCVVVSTAGVDKVWATIIHSMFEGNSSFMWDSALRGKFNLFFKSFLLVLAKISLAGGLGAGLSFYGF